MESVKQQMYHPRFDRKGIADITINECLLNLIAVF